MKYNDNEIKDRKRAFFLEMLYENFIKRRAKLRLQAKYLRNKKG